jgi:hypothetical protein
LGSRAVSWSPGSWGLGLPSLAPGILTPGFPSRGPGPDSWGPGPLPPSPRLPSVSLVRLVSRPCPSSSPVRPSPVLLFSRPSFSPFVLFRPSLLPPVLPSFSSPVFSRPSSPVRPPLPPVLFSRPLPSSPLPLGSLGAQAQASLSLALGPRLRLSAFRFSGSGIQDSGFRIQDSGIGRSVLRQDKKGGQGDRPSPPFVRRSSPRLREAAESPTASSGYCPR